MNTAIRVLVAKPGFEGHDRGAKDIRCALRDDGMEVIYTGLRQTSEMIVNAALGEDVQAIGLRFFRPRTIDCARAPELLKGNQMDDVTVVVGGIVSDDDTAALKQLGMAEVLRPAASLEKIIQFIRDSVKQVA